MRKVELTQRRSDHEKYIMQKVQNTITCVEVVKEHVSTESISAGN